MIPGKRRCIGRAIPGADRWERLVNGRYCLATLPDGDRSGLVQRMVEWGSAEAYARWLDAYRRNAGNFLDHPAWGADRDLGGGVHLHGAMDDRFATNLERLVRGGGLVPDRHVFGRDCCVVGCWDGTENLLLHALGAVRVDGIEEVDAFCEMTDAQLRAWDVPGRVVHRGSLYEVDVRSLWERYALVYVPGVLYHLTDPAAALLLLWAMLRPGGTLAVESIASGDPAPQDGWHAARYLGPSRPGWNWWSPTPGAWCRMMQDAGFPDARTVEFAAGRGWWVGTKRGPLPLAAHGAAGFSRPDVLRTVRELSG